MKVNKTQALLYIITVLYEKGHFRRIEILQEVEISDLTFRRYMQELRAFFSNFMIDKNIRYNREDDTYYLD